MLDSYGRQITYLRLSVTELCNLRCRYCMPAEGICKKDHSDMLTEEEMISAVRACAALGINKVRITGGEPLVKKNIISICRKAAEVPGISELCITSNGLLMSEMASDLKSAGVKRVNLSLDTLDSEKYKYITRQGSLDMALRGLKAAIDTGFEKVRINAVLIGGFNDDEIPVMAELTRQYPVDVRFIELMPMYDSGDFGPDAFIPGNKVLEALPELKPETDIMPDPERENRNISEDVCSKGVARTYKLPGAIGLVGIISPLSDHFCSTCNRIRITADGWVKPCLHRQAEYSIKGMDEEQMKEQIRAAILHKPEWHGELSPDARSQAGRNMNRIGG